MKHVLLLAFCVLLSARVLSAQSFTVSLTPASQSITVGESATYSVVITPLNGYDASVFLSVSSPGFKGSAVLSNTVPNPPFANITLTVKPSIPDTGIKTLTITAQNGNVKMTATCSIATKKNAQWGAVKPPLRARFFQKSLEADFAGNVCLATREEETLLLNHFKDQKWEVDKLQFNSTTYSSHEYSIAPFAYDTKGTLWCATPQGVVRYDGKFMTIFDKSNSGIAINYIQAIEIDRNGLPVFLAFDNYHPGSTAYIIRYDGVNFTTFNTRKASVRQSRGWNANFSIDSQNRILLPTSNGLIRIQDTIQEVINTNAGGEGATVACDKDGGIWYLDGNGRLSYFNGTTWNTIDSPTTGTPKTFIVDNDKNIWLLSTIGMHTYNGSTWTTYTPSNSPISAGDMAYVQNEQPMLMQDKNKNIWMLIHETFYVFNPTGLVDIPLAPSGVDEQPAPSDGITLYPNPTSTTFTISGISSVLGYNIVNTMGMEVLPPQEFVSGKQEVDVSGLVAGVYFVQMRTASGMMTKPIVVVH